LLLGGVFLFFVDEGKGREMAGKLENNAPFD